MNRLRNYIKSFDNISSSSKHEEYINVKSEIKDRCKNDSRYENVDFIDLEIERIEENIETKKSPYLSILYAFFATTLSLLIPNLINLNTFNKGQTATKSDQLFNVLFILVMIVYIVVVFIVFINKLRKQEGEFQCYIVYKKVLNELRQEIENSND
ncbi:hypothetical protein CBE01nite_25360 [Clostridium beijerinckii]|uniref:Uncharacterized protein n=1 Tax=Clostridium beijerinckii TaxID=1520 RepID=A0AB74VMT4_CLOBE|nr:MULTISPECIES: hypothetical protein [Clostridium]NRZ29539.1 ABC-type sugar transport system permease subunit [Clostridium beijerinckii]NYC00040.1 ABC-type sugar transport system permease subunit [Clostridium beijerinckii]OOM22698.1 hypothetical protein CLBEI_30980 [Clostridium beijerinckii]PSM56668.1 hypothetical protein C4L39_16230 [Clostridium diolis]QUN37958.1 hypothetical protein KEC93_26070 [Clostridium beijerinckii]